MNKAFYRLRILAVFFPALLSGVAAPAADDPGLPALTAGEQIQNAISAKLTQITADQRDKQKPGMDRLIADIQRTLHLSEERLALLHVAAAGVLQRAQEPMARRVVAEAERRTKGVSPKVAGKVLSSMDGFNQSRLRLSEDAFWKDALRQLLTDQERLKWETVVAERAAYRAHAIAEYLLVRIKPVLSLDAGQEDKLLPLLQKAVQDYLPDAFVGWMSDEEDRGLYFGYVPVFVLGVPEADARTVIREAQWEKWRRAAGEYAGEWEWIKSVHDERVKKEEERKE